MSRLFSSSSSSPKSSSDARDRDYRTITPQDDLYDIDVSDDETEKQKLIRLADERKKRREMILNQSSTTTIDPRPTPTRHDVIKISSSTTQQQVIPKKSILTNDNEDDFDMFGIESPSVLPVPQTSSLTTSAQTSVDVEGRIRIQAGDVLDNGVVVVGIQGAGAFSTVLKGTDKDGRDVVVKVLRANDVMFKSGEVEGQIIRQLAEMHENKHPNTESYIVELLQEFKHQDHKCLMFPALHSNLREFIATLGCQGLNMNSVRRVATQLLAALSILAEANIVHTDIKPDNILAADNRLSKVLLCDFGTAHDYHQPFTATDYVASRFYRAPELCLGLSYGCGVDMWALGCVLFELYTGKVLFTGNSNNQMLQFMMEIKGPMPKRKVILKGKFSDQHFDKDGGFLERRKDTATGNEFIHRVFITHATKSLTSVIKNALKGSLNPMETSKLPLFVDFLERLLELDPSIRMTAADALKHPFITDV